jgi:hypothetical protein
MTIKRVTDVNIAKYGGLAGDGIALRSSRQNQAQFNAAATTNGP